MPERDAGYRVAVRRLVVAYLLLGVGIAALFDGIVLHQLLQWHHMVSARTAIDTVDGLRDNVVGDGLFHLGAIGAAAAGLVLRLRAPARDVAAFATLERVGWVALGAGAFNVVEGLVDHHLLAIHHVRDDVAEPLPWDLTFLGINAVLALIGLALVRRAWRGGSAAGR